MRTQLDNRLLTVPMATKDSFTFVVVGGGIAGISCIEMLAQIAESSKTDAEWSVLLITASPIVKRIRNVIQISKLVSTFDVEEMSAGDYAAEQTRASVEVLSDVVKGIDVEEHEVRTKGGRVIKYDRLCLCHGARPRILPEAEDNPRVMGIRDTESVRDFKEKLAGATRVVIVGNGGIATELVHELKGVEVVWAIKDDSIAAAFVDAGAGEFLYGELNKDTKGNEEKSEGDGGTSLTKRMRYTVSAASRGPPVPFNGAALGPDWHRGINVEGHQEARKEVAVEYECHVRKLWRREDFELSEKVESKAVDSKAWPIYVELSNDKVYGCDLVVSATGVIPNGDLICPALFERDPVDGGIVVDDMLRTSAKDVFAAGDVCHAKWEADPPRHWFQMRLWTQARQLGLFAGQCMAASLRGEEIARDFSFEVFTHATKFFGFKVVLLGLFNGQTMTVHDYEVLLRVTKGKEYVKAVMSKEGRMQGAVLIGETDLEETFENLILNQMDLSQFGEDLLDPNVDIEDFFD